MGKFYLTVRDSTHGSVVAVCEKEIFGKKFEEGDLVLDLTTAFYFEEGKTIETGDVELIVEKVREAFTSNIVGNSIVDALLERGIIKRSGVKSIAGVKYAMTFKI